MTKTKPAPQPAPDPTGPTETAPPDAIIIRIIFAALILYTGGLALMVLEDILNHTFF